LSLDDEDVVKGVEDEEEDLGLNAIFEQVVEVKSIIVYVEDKTKPIFWLE
jgi:hypothetical protein